MSRRPEMPSDPAADLTRERDYFHHLGPSATTEQLQALEDRAAREQGRIAMENQRRLSIEVMVERIKRLGESSCLVERAPAI